MLRPNHSPLWIVILIAISLLLLSGCGEAVSGVITLDDYTQIHNSMTMDDVEALIGAPQRSHRLGSSKVPTVYWYYSKTEGEGLVRVAFENGKVVSISPYNLDLNPEE